MALTFFQIAFDENHSWYNEHYYQKKKKEQMGWGQTFVLAHFSH